MTNSFVELRRTGIVPVSRRILTNNRSDDPMPRGGRPWEAGPAKALPLPNNGPSQNPLNEESEDIAAGVAALLRGDDFEAHEHWESHWRKLPTGPEKLGLQGLILVAVGRYKLAQGKPHIAQRLWRRAQDRLAQAPSCFLGFSREAWLSWLRALSREPRTPVPPACARR